MKARRVRLITVAAGNVSADLAVAADAPMTYLSPVLAETLGLRIAGIATLWTADGRPIRRTDTLFAAGVQDGQTLRLSTDRPEIGGSP